MKLVTARFLIADFKYAILIIFIVAAVITPDRRHVTQTIFAAPMVGLYLLSIVIAWVVGPKRLQGGEAKSTAVCTTLAQLSIDVELQTVGLLSAELLLPREVQP